MEARLCQREGTRRSRRRALGMSGSGGIDAIADRILDPRRAAPTPLAVGRGGELIVETTGTRNYRADQLRDTVSSNPDMITAQASQERLDLAIQAGVLALAADAADTIGAANSFEKMLAAQLAALHTITMKNAATAASFANIAADGYVPDDQRQVASVEAARSANVAARASEAFQRGILTLDKFRNGGRQTVVVSTSTSAKAAGRLLRGKCRTRGWPPMSNTPDEPPRGRARRRQTPRLGVGPGARRTANPVGHRRWQMGGAKTRRSFYRAAHGRGT